MGIQWDRVKAIVFDLDDTLIDWQAIEHHAMGAVAGAHLQAHPEEHVRRHYAEVKKENFAAFKATGTWWFIGDRLERLNRRLGIDTPLDPMVATFTGAVTKVLEMRPGALESLALARSRHKTAILTNGPARVQRPKVDLLGLAPLVDEVCIAGEMDLWKPHPEAFQETLRRLGVEATHALMVGDSCAMDIEPASVLGMQTLLVGPECCAADETIAQIAHFPSLMRRVATGA